MRSEVPDRHCIGPAFAAPVECRDITNRDPQMSALARALAIEPQMLLPDAPFWRAERQSLPRLASWRRDIHDKTGPTTIFVTGDQHDAMALADPEQTITQKALCVKAVVAPSQRPSPMSPRKSPLTLSPAHRARPDH